MYHHATTPNKLQFLLWISKSLYNFLSIPYSPFGSISNTLSMRLFTNCAHRARQYIHNQMLKSHQQNGIQWATARRKHTARDIVGLWSSIYWNFNLNLRKIAKWFRSSLPCTSFTHSLFNICIQFAKCNFIFFYFYQLENLLFLLSVYDSYSIYSIPQNT